MPTTQLPLDLYISEVRASAGAPLLAVRRRTAKLAGTPLLTVGDFNIPVRVWFYEQDPASSALITRRHNGDTIVLVGKMTAAADAETLFLVGLATEGQDAAGDWYYSGTLALNSPATVAAIKRLTSVLVDVVINGEATSQFSIELRPQVFAGNEVAPASPEAAFFQTLANTATAAAASASAASGASAMAASSAATHEGFATAAAAAASASASAAATSEASANTSATSATASKNAAAASATSTASLAATASSSATAAANSATAAAASATAAAAAIAPANSRASATQTVRGDDLRLAEAGGITCANGALSAGTPLSFSTDFEIAMESDPTVARSGTLLPLVFSDGAFNVSFTAADFAGRRYLGVRYTSATGVLRAVTEAGTGAILTTRALNATCTLAGIGTASGHLRSFSAYNVALSAAQRLQVMKGETPAELSRQMRFVSSSSYAEEGDVNNRLTVSGNTFTKLAGTEAGFADCYARLVPLLSSPVRGAKLRIVLTVNQTAGLAADLPILKIGDYGTWNGTFTVNGVAGNERLRTGTNVYECDLATFIPAGNHRVTLNWSTVYGGTSGATTFSITQPVVIESIGTAEDYHPDRVSPSGRWMGRFGNDLIPGAGITPIDPDASLSRVIAVNAAGATVAVNTIASIGAISGIGPADINALASIRQHDALAVSWGQARPANSTAPHAIATANGTVSVEVGALGSSATISANSPLKIIHQLA